MSAWFSRLSPLSFSAPIRSVCRRIFLPFDRGAGLCGISLRTQSGRSGHMPVCAGRMVYTGVFSPGSPVAVALPLKSFRNPAADFSPSRGPRPYPAPFFRNFPVFSVREGKLPSSPRCPAPQSSPLREGAIRPLNRPAQQNRLSLLGYRRTVTGATCLLLSVAGNVASQSPFT